MKTNREASPVEDRDRAPLAHTVHTADSGPSRSRILRHYCGQVRACLDVTGAERGLIVALTSGTVTLVMPTVSGKP